MSRSSSKTHLSVLVQAFKTYLQRNWGKDKQLSLRPEPPPVLPIEIIERIADYYFEVQPPDASDLSPICCTKPRWSDVANFMMASPDLHRMGFMRWVAVLTIRNYDDWESAIQYSQWIRELNCLDGALVQPRHQRILVDFTHLRSLSIDSHGDITHDEHNHFAYRDLIRALPFSLRRLEITRAHGPDIKIIATVKECCPDLEELRLGRCTVFNSSSACDFWRSFPLDHDSYMSSEDTNSYANSLAQELAPLQSLKTLRVGLYLVPSTTILAHRLYHRRGRPAPHTIDWQQAIPLAQVPAPVADLEPATIDQLVSLLHERDPETEFGEQHICTMCTEAIEQTTKDAEIHANLILSEVLPSLVKIQWMGWLTAGHLGVNSYKISLSH